MMARYLRTLIRPFLRPLGVLRLVLALIAIGRLARAARRPPPLAIDPSVDPGPISVVIPARDEAERIGPLLAAVVGAPGVSEVIVVDDESTDDTAALARSLGADVVAGTPPPPGWAGKTWALHQGIAAAAHDRIVTLDADTRPDRSLPQAAAARAVSDDVALLTVAGRYDSATAGARWLHAALLTTLVYRFGPPGTDRRPDRLLANGQCMVIERPTFDAAGGWWPVRQHVVEDVALARHLATTGQGVGFVDGSSLLTVRMYDTFVETAVGWGRSIGLPGIEPFGRRLVDGAVVVAAQALPLWRVVLGRSDALDVVLLLMRAGTLAGTATASVRRGPAYWLSPFADLLAAALVLRSSFTTRQSWRGRQYETGR